MAEVLDELLVKIGIDADDVASEVDDTAGLFKGMAGKLGAGLTAAGAGLEAFNRSQQDTTVAIGNLSDATGISEQAIRDLATETSNATFPLEEVLALMESGRKSGITGGKALQDYAFFWDKVGDASGESGPELGKAGVALRALGIAAGQESKAIDALGFVMRNTQDGTKGFLDFISRTGPELRELGLDVNDTAALLGLMESKLGLTGRQARTEFREAVNESDGSMKDLLKTLGISPEAFEKMRKQVEGSGKAIEDQAQNFADSRTPMQQMEDTLNDLLVKIAPFADTIAILAPILIGLGAAIMIATFATWAFNAAIFANPIFWIVLAIIALIAVIVVLIAHWDQVAAAVGQAWDWIVGKLGEAWDWIVDRFNQAIAWLRGVWDGIWKFFEDRINLAIAGARALIDGIVTWIIDRINVLRALPGMVGAFFRAMAVRAITKGVQLVTWVRGLPGKIGRFLRSLPDILKAAGKGALNALWAGLKSVWNSVERWFRDKVDWIRGLWPFSPAEHGPLRANPMDQAGANVVDLLRIGIQDATPGLLAQLGDVAEAVSMPGVRVSVPTVPGIPDIPDVRRGRDGAATLGGDLPDEFVATGTFDLGEGITQVVNMTFERRDRALKRRVKAGTGAAR